MSIIAGPDATRAVELFVLSLNTHLASTPNVPAARAGEKRAAAREKAQAKAMKSWHESAEKARKGLPVSRQVRRRMKMKQQKSLYSAQRRAG